MSHQAPIAGKKNQDLVHFEDKRQDPYYWLRDENWQEVLQKPDVLRSDIRDYLEAENRYKDDHLKDCEDLTKALGDEFVSRLIPNESTVPVKDGAYEYWLEYEAELDYPRHKRRHLETGKQEIVLDENEQAKAHDFFDLHALDHSPDHNYLAFAVDTQGSEYYTIFIKDLKSGELLPNSIEKTSGDFEWSAGSNILYYVESDDHKRPKKIKAHDLFHADQPDYEIYHEQSDEFFLSIDKTMSGAYILIQLSQSETSEVHFFKSDAGLNPSLTLIHAREAGLEYDVDHRGDDFYIRTNADGAEEFKIVKAPITNPSKENWVDVVGARDDGTITGLICYQNFFVRKQRHNALGEIIVSDYEGREKRVHFPDQAYVVSLRSGYEFETQTIRYFYQTMAHPGRLYEFDVVTGSQEVLKERKLPSGHNPENYKIERIFVKAEDGAEIPVSLLYHESVKPDGSAPLFQYGYGSYGIIVEPAFSSTAISLVDRGMIYAIAHIRGGGDKGQYWYKQGKKAHKKNSFTDFIRVSEDLVSRGYGKAGDITIEGRSAGGLLMGAVVNMRPDLYCAVIAGVPFVDVLTTILDDSLPLTPPEWEEWGNPLKDRQVYDYMKSYSPYDNIRGDIEYPLIIAPAGLTDPRVTYWEPAKWIAKLRDEAKGGPFLLKMNMGSGHFGSTARYDKVRERADEYALCLKRLQDKGYSLQMID